MPRAVHVKLHPDEADRLASLDDRLRHVVRALAELDVAVRVGPSFDMSPHSGATRGEDAPDRAAERNTARVRRILNRAYAQDPSLRYTPVDIEAWFRVELPDTKAARAALRRIRRSGSFAGVAHTRPTRSPDLKNVAPSYKDQHWFFDVGADAVTAPGRLGDGVGVVDVERGWEVTISAGSMTLQHPELAHLAPVPETPVDTVVRERHHGTQSLGILFARWDTPDDPADDSGIVGLCPNATLTGLFGTMRASNEADVASALLAAAEVLGFGDVVLLEVQTTVGGRLLPAEADPRVREATRVLTALGVLVVAAAGNSGVNLDAWQDENGVSSFVGSGFDSGALMVAAGIHNGSSWVRKSTSNHGVRINCFARGADVITTTLSGAAAKLDTGFSDTSAASAIVAGVAVATQGMARAAGLQLTPWQVRRLLSTCGAPGAPGIGVMPWLPTIAASLSALPDVFVRDDELDEGERPRLSGLSGLSPDIRVVDGAGTTLEIDVHNRGAANASETFATVYAYSPAALLYAGGWITRHTSGPVSVPAGGTTTISLGAPGRPSPVALLVVLSSSLDAGPALPTGYWTWRGLVTSSNNVAVRAVSREAATGSGAFITSTLVRGPSSTETLEETQQPIQSVRVRVSSDGASTFDVTAPEALRARLAINNGETATYPVSADWLVLGTGKLEPGFEAALGVSVAFGNELRIEVSQVCEGVEVGRYTWVRSTPGGGGNTGRRGRTRGR